VSDDFASKSEVRALARRVLQLEQAVVHLTRRRIAAEDSEWLASLLPAIYAVIGDGVWVLCELAALALLPGNDALAAALAARGGRTSLQALGKRFARCAGHVVDGFELRRVGTCRDGVLWQVSVAMNVAETRAAD
jgi:hypothetical protein